MSDLVYWHNPRCSKSREALALLHENGYQPAIVTYLTLPPTKSELRRAISLLNLPVIAMMRIKEKRFAELGLHSGSTTVKNRSSGLARSVAATSSGRGPSACIAFITGCTMKGSE